MKTRLSLERHQVCVELTYGQNSGIVGGRQGHDVGLLQVHSLGWSAPGSEGVVSVLSADVLLLHRAGPTGGRLLCTGAAGVLLHCLRKKIIIKNSD